MGNTQGLHSNTATSRMAYFLMKTGGGPKEEARRRVEIRKMFTKADKNGDGKLTPQEWKTVLNSSGVCTTMEEVEEFFQSMDRDFDGRLTFEEFMGEETTLEKLFKNMDKNGDGVVTKQEFMTICKNLTDEQVKMAFAKFDTSGDDKLDYREFCEMIRKKEEERNM